MFTVDTGATTTILSHRVYMKVPAKKRPTLTQVDSSCDLVGADGNSLNYTGRAVFEISIGSVSLVKEMAVAHISDDALLGADVLQRDESGPVDLLLTQNCMVFRDVSIPVHQVGLNSKPICARAADHFVVPGMSQATIDVFIDSTDTGDRVDGVVLVESKPGLQEEQTMLLGPTVLDMTNSATGQVLLMNPFPEPRSIKQDTIVGHVEIIDNVESQLVTGDSQLLYSGTASDHQSSDLINMGEKIAAGTHSQDCICPEPAAAALTRDSDFAANCRERVAVVHNDLAQAGKVDTALSDHEEQGESSSCSAGSLSQYEIPGHLTDLFERSILDKTDEEKHAIAKLLIEFCEIFSKHDNDLGCTTLAEHSIDTGDATPVRIPPRRMPLAFAGEDKAALKKLQEQGSIRPSTSPWAAPLVLVRKKDGSVRPCVDYRRLNSVTKRDAFPIPHSQDCLDAFQGAELFSTLDITSAYNQIPVRERDIPKTAFVTKYGLYEFMTMPFGLCNAPATFQRLMEVALSGLQWTHCLVYLDDVIIYGRDFREHLARLRLVLDRIRQAKLKLKPRKCFFFQVEVKFLGHVLSKNGILPNPDNVKKLLDWPVPKNVTEVRGILGLGSYYRRFVKDFSARMLPLIELTKKGKAFIWSEDCQAAFEDLKSALTGPDIMGFPSDQGHFILDTDASDFAIGAVLSQIQDGAERVIAYGSHALNRAERNYCVTDRELLAVKHFIQQYKHYLLGRKFTVRTDHRALRWLFSLKDPKSRIARWIELLSAFDFEIEHRAGVRHGNADALSRCPNPRTCSCTVDGSALQCGPCKKCLKRSMDMMSNLQLGYETVRLVRGTEKSQGISFMGVFSLMFTKLGVFGTLFLICLLGSLIPVTGGNHLASSRGVALPATCRRVESPSWLPPYNKNDLRRQQLADSEIGPVLRWKEAGSRPFGAVVCSSKPATRHYWNSWDSLVIQDGVLYRTFVKKDTTGSYLQLIVPQKLRSELLHQMHDTVISGHLGKRKHERKYCNVITCTGSECETMSITGYPVVISVLPLSPRLNLSVLLWVPCQ